MKKLLLLLLTIICFACSYSDDDNNCSGLSTDGIEITQDFITTGLSYFADPTNAACGAYENAAQRCIDYSNSVLDCLEADDRPN